MNGTVQAEFQQGETIQLGLQAISGDPSVATSMSAKAKRAGPGLSLPDASVPAALTFTVTHRAGTSDVPAGYDLVGPGTLDPGIYCANWQGTIAGAIVKSDPIFFRVTPSPT